MIFAMVVWAGSLHAHEIRPSVADVSARDGFLHMIVRANLEAFLSKMDLSAIARTSQAEETGAYDRFRSFPSGALADAFRAQWPVFSRGLLLKAGGVLLKSELLSVEVGRVGDVELLRNSVLRLRAPLPEEAQTFTVGWKAQYGTLIVRHDIPEEGAYSGYLTKGTISDPIPVRGAVVKPAVTEFFEFVIVGFQHILPEGLDHILFVLGLFLLSLRLRPLLVQVTAFTIAHTVTLALASLGYIALPPGIVEPIIAGSIVYVAVENIFSSRLHFWRPAVVFAFGLVHGLGFAAALGETGLGGSRFLLRLVGFNVGVEAGQLAIIVPAFLLLATTFGGRPWFRARISIPVSIAIAFVGAYWALERIFF